jgi:hypothetical protein
VYFSSLLNLPPTHYSKLFHLITLTILTEQCQLQDSSLCVSIFMLFLSLRFIHSPQHLILRHHQSTFFHYGERPISHPHKITVTKCRLLALKWRRSVCFDEGLHIYIYIYIYIYYDEEASFSVRRSILLRSGKEGRKEKKRRKGVRYGFILSCRSYGSSCIQLNYL